MNRWLRALALGIIAVLLHQLLFATVGLRFEAVMADFWFNWKGPSSPPEDVILIAMDEDSYEELSIPMNQAWPRATHVQLLKRLAAAGAKRVVFDVLFLGPSDDPQTDAELAKALNLLPTVIGADSGSSVGSVKIEELFLPFEAFRNAVEEVALVGLPEDAGGIVRRFKTNRLGRTSDFPTLAEAAAEVKRSQDDIPHPQDYISYYGPRGTIPTFSYYEVLDPQIVQDKELKEKTAFVGLLLRTGIGPAQKDSYLTPYWKANHPFENSRVFGVEIHATAAANLMTSNWLHRANPNWEALVLAVLSFVLAALIYLLGPRWSTCLITLSLSGWLWASYLTFTHSFFIPGATLMLLVLPFVYLLCLLHYYFVIYQTQKQTQRAFERYLAPEMVRQVKSNPRLLELGGSNTHATALFTDIAEFTNLTENMPAEDVATMLNCYFTEVMQVLFKNQGTLIKFIGDSVFAIWGAPLKITNHAELATRAAIGIQQEVEHFNATQRFAPLHTRIGIHTGPMVIGNLGSKKRFDYTAIGDSVNLASRLEGLNKYYGTSILISRDTKRELSSTIKTHRMGYVNVAGKREAVEIFAILDTPLSKTAEATWEKALDKFAVRDWEAATALFDQVKDTGPQLVTACKLYQTQIIKNREEVLDTDWQGAIVFTSK
jgi:adenylate cyclase